MGSFIPSFSLSLRLVSVSQAGLHHFNAKFLRMQNTQSTNWTNCTTSKRIHAITQPFMKYADALSCICWFFFFFFFFPLKLGYRTHGITQWRHNACNWSPQYMLLLRHFVSLDSNNIIRKNKKNKKWLWLTVASLFLQEYLIIDSLKRLLEI